MSKRSKLGLGLAATLVVGLGLYLLAWPVPIEPVAWTPPVAKDWPVNDRLAPAASVSVAPLGEGPEDVAIDADGRMIVGLANGKVVRLVKDGAAPEVIADTGGRTLGLQFDGSGNLWICDAYTGLHRLTPDGKLELLATECDGIPFGCTNDLDIAKDGTVYFSDATSAFGVREFKLDLLEHGGKGRLLKYDPKTKAVTQLLAGLTFANGVALAHDESFVLVAETGTYSVHRYWLEGEKQGTQDVFAENLPGFPDGISTGSKLFWLALASPRDGILDVTLPRPFLRKVICRLPEALQPKAQRHGFVLGLDREGNIVEDLQHRAADSLSPVTSVQEHEGRLYLGTLDKPRFGILPVPTK